MSLDSPAERLRAAAKRYGKAYRVRWEWLVENEGAPRSAPRAQIVGHVGAGAEMYFEKGQGPFGDVAMPPGVPENTVAAEIRGDSLGPFNGWFAYFSDRRDAPSRDLIGHLCIVGLTDDRILIKRIAAGRKARRFDLWGAGGEPLQDQRVEWAALVTALLSPRLAKAN